tara:strand:+ start:1766 stop:2938 length:1173 start_codon:yes stop_codon:yes gene_type:complete
MFEQVQKLFNENSVKNCYFIYLKKNANKFESNSISFGKSHWNNKQDLNGDHIFRILSMSKPITALAAMQLVEKGILNLDSPVEQFLPEIKEIPVLNIDNKLVKQSKSITLRHLMSHTSGFAYNSLVMNTSKKIKDLSIYMKTILFLKGIITYIYPFSKGPRLFEAGTDFKYGTGFGFVGMMIEKATGQSLEEYCKENIFNPLDMKNTFFTIPREKKDKIVPLGIRQGKKSKVIRKMPFKGQPYLRFWRKSYYGGTEIFSSPNDYANFVKCLMNKGNFNDKQIISESSFNEMIKPGKFDQMFERDHSYNFIMGENGRIKNKMNRYGLGLTISFDPNDSRPVGSIAHGGAACTFFSFNLEKQKAALIFSNFYPYNDKEWHEMVVAFENEIYA